ncbi:16S rRNA (guanine(966)-N(2))-methyltransferase RsmD [bacterium]|nr:16S rRNA (guanine(966)-N(2))-methyltransferase RsmD [bacterium]
MKIIGGEFGGRRLKALKSIKMRPTPMRVKEALFNILCNRVVGSSFLDLYAGSGQMGIEALSRGAKEVIFVDNHPSAIRLIRTNLGFLPYEKSPKIPRNNVLRVISSLSKEKKRFDIIFLDPPYESRLVKNTLQALAKSDILKITTLVIAEHHKSLNLDKEIGSLGRVRQERYGDTVLTFYQKVRTVGE